MRKTLALTCLLAIGLPMSASVSTAADEAPALQPIATVAFSGYDEIKEDLRFVGELAGSPELVVGLEFMLKMMLGGRGLEGLDEDRPWGAVISLDDTDIEARLAQKQPDLSEAIQGCLFLPVTDADALMSVLEPFFGKPEALEGGIYQVNMADGPSLYAKPEGDWLFLSPIIGSLEQTPTDPISLLDGLHEQYDLAARYHIGRLPPRLMEGAIAGFETKMRDGLQRNPDEPEGEYRARRFATVRLLNEAKMFLKGLDAVTVGWNLNHDTGTTCLDCELTAKPDSPLAHELSVLGKVKSRFAAIDNIDAAFKNVFAVKLSKRHRELATDLGEFFKTETLAAFDEHEPDATQRKHFGQVTDILIDTLTSRVIEGGGFVDLDVDNMTIAVAGAMSVSDGLALEEVLLEIVEMIREAEPKMIDRSVKLHVQEYLGVDIHELTFPLPPDIARRERWVELVGEEVHLRLGIDEETVYFEAGRESTDAMETLIGHIKGGSPMAVDVARWECDVQNYAAFGAAIEGDNGEIPLQMLADALAESPGEDRITVTLGRVEDGLRLHVEISRGILEAAAKAGSGTILKGMGGG